MNKSLYAARRRRNLISMGFSLAATAFGLGWLVLILGALLYEGFSGLSLRVFAEMTPPRTKSSNAFWWPTRTSPST